jgi:hypothetical protein
VVARILSLVAALALGGCGGADYPPNGRQTLKGFAVVGGEIWAFQLCGSPLLISVDIQGTEPGIDKLNRALPFDCPNCPLSFAYAELDAVVTDDCPCGHIGKYSHELAIKEVLAASATPPPSCPHVEPHYPQ